MTSINDDKALEITIRIERLKSFIESGLSIFPEYYKERLKQLEWELSYITDKDGVNKP